MSLNLRGTYHGKPNPKPPSCTTPRQPSMYNNSLFVFSRNFGLILTQPFSYLVRAASRRVKVRALKRERLPQDHGCPLYSSGSD